ncbi:hypothetical protein GEMMAAP_15640 [Gemmatimonas phototrophica]|uniref:Glycosyltransferase RgtA/B/C/D-like domain-containing protein n=2 Tax=Gemmatimonas phototrophica TaxID=1379270 RepID=A0A143BLC4_9BACT|nr:hypothetical protein GEMMAAP_15640 [Gemmatimonas phototrophica]
MQQHRALLYITMACVLLFVLLRIPLFVWGDTWFNLVLGREVAESGMITSNRTTAVGWGMPVVDVQWFAHYLFFVVEGVVGIAGVIVAGAALVAASFMWGAHFSVRHRATAGRTLLVTLTAFAAMGAQVVLRAQTLAYPFLLLFPAMLWLDSRHASKRTWWLVPAAALWANLHGSVLLAPIFAGALLVGRQLDRLRAGQGIDGRAAARDAVLAVTLAAAVFATPYGADVLQYYRNTAGNPVFRDFITEWYPLWSNGDVGGIAFLAMVVTALWHARAKTDAYTMLMLAGLGVMFATSIRHATPLALASLVLLPRVLDEALGQNFPLEFSQIRSAAARVVLAIASALFLVGLPLLALDKQRLAQPTALVARVAAAAVPGQCILVDEQQADRFLWYFPRLKGIVAHDVRVETLPAEYLRALGRAYANATLAASDQWFREFHVIVMDARMHPELIAELHADSTFVTIGSDATIAAFARRHATTTLSPCTTPSELRRAPSVTET